MNPSDNANASDGPEIAPAAAVKICPGCGTQFPAGGRGMGKNFCTTDCRRAFQGRMANEGQAMAALVKAWIATRHAEPGTEAAEICRFARSELTHMASHWNDRDAAKDRPDALAYVRTLMNSGTRFMDRR